MDFRAILILSLSILVSCSSSLPVAQSSEEQDQASSQAASDAPVSFKYKVKDEGEDVEEEITIDKDKQTETFHVPAHKDKQEADIIKDFKLNLTMYRIPAKKVCLLTPLQKDEKSPDELMEDLKKDTGNSDSQGSNTTTSEWHGDKLLEDRSFLSDEMAVMCAKYPIYKMEEGLGSGRMKRDTCLDIYYVIVCSGPSYNRVCRLYKVWHFYSC